MDLCKIFNREVKLDSDTEKSISELNPDYIFYHKNCPDGITSAYIAWRYYNRKPICVEENPNFRLTGIEIGSNILIVDLSPANLEDIKYLYNIWIIDHHISTYKKYKKYKKLIYGGDANEWSAALMCKKIFGSKESWIDYISDRDTWSWKLVNSAEINEAIYVEELVNNIFDIDKNLDRLGDLIELTERGKIYLKYKNKLVKDISKSAHIINNTAIVNCPILQSDIGNYLIKQLGCEISIIYRIRDPISMNEIVASVRSDTGKALNVASRFGGGGHKNAAGFTTTVKEWKKKISKNPRWIHFKLEILFMLAVVFILPIYLKLYTNNIV